MSKTYLTYICPAMLLFYLFQSTFNYICSNLSLNLNKNLAESKHFCFHLDVTTNQWKCRETISRESFTSNWFSSVHSKCNLWRQIDRTFSIEVSPTSAPTLAAAFDTQLFFENKMFITGCPLCFRLLKKCFAQKEAKVWQKAAGNWYAQQKPRGYIFKIIS